MTAWGYKKGQFHHHLRNVLKARGMTMADVKREVARRAPYPTTTAFDTLDSIHAGRRSASPLAVLEIAEAIGAPEEFPDYYVNQLRYRLDPAEVGEAEAERFAVLLLDSMKAKTRAAEGLVAPTTVKLAQRASEAAQRLGGTPAANPGTRRVEGDGAG